MWTQSSKTKGWKGDGGLGGLSPEATEKVSHLVPRMEDERRALHSCTAPQGPFCKYQRRGGPLAWNARMLSWSQAALWAVQAPPASCLPGPQPREVLWLLHHASVLPRPAGRLS